MRASGNCPVDLTNQNLRFCLEIIDVVSIYVVISTQLKASIADSV